MLIRTFPAFAPERPSLNYFLSCPFMSTATEWLGKRLPELTDRVDAFRLGSRSRRTAILKEVTESLNKECQTKWKKHLTSNQKRVCDTSLPLTVELTNAD